MKSIDFSKGIRGKYANENLRVIGEKKPDSKSSWAICITRREKNLIPLKIYEVKARRNSSTIEVVDETDNAAIYLQKCFLPINLLEKEAELLIEFALSI